MEEGFRYIHERTKGKKRISGLTSYVDSYTIGLSHSIMGKAEEVLNNRGIYEVLKENHIKIGGVVMDFNVQGFVLYYVWYEKN